MHQKFKNRLSNKRLLLACFFVLAFADWLGQSIMNSAFVTWTVKYS